MKGIDHQLDEVSSRLSYNLNIRKRNIYESKPNTKWNCVKLRGKVNNLVASLDKQKHQLITLYFT